MPNQTRAPKRDNRRSETTPRATARRPGQRRAHHRPRPWWRGPWPLISAVAGIALIVGIFVAVSASQGTPSQSGGAPPATPAPASVLQAVTSPDPGALAAIGDGGVPNPLKPLSGAPRLTGASGSPELLYVGADYCPYCAAERWSLVAALSRFGTVSGLRLMTSSSSDVYPDTATFTFETSRFSSPSLSFVPIETATRDRQPLQTPTAAQEQILATYDAPPYSPSAGGIPFLDFGGRFVAVSSGYIPTVLSGLTWEQIATDLRSPTSPQARAIFGNANWISAGLCEMTGDQPSSVCASGPIPALERRLRSSGNGS